MLDRFVGKPHRRRRGQGGKKRPDSGPAGKGPENEYGQETVLDQVDAPDGG
jgi:hypothetical protein